MIDETELKPLKDMLGYTEAQWETWKNNPRNLKMAENLKDYSKYKIIAEVTNSSGCAAGHRVGDKIVYSGASLFCKENPEQICTYLLDTMNPFVRNVFVNLASGVDVTQMATKAHCPDVGVENGGWGEVIVEMKVEET